MFPASLFESAIYKVAELSRVQIAAAVGTTPAELGPFTFRFPRAVEVTGLLVLPADGTAASLAQLSIGILDEHDEQIVTDYRGVVAAQEQPFVVPCLSLMGKDFRTFALQRLVCSGDRWLFTLKNFSAAAIDVGVVALLYKGAPFYKGVAA